MSEHTISSDSRSSAFCCSTPTTPSPATRSGKTGPNDAISIRNNLQTLVALNWMTAFHVQFLRKYAINMEHKAVKHLTAFVKAICYR
jgi:hypothetical protein